MKRALSRRYGRASGLRSIDPRKKVRHFSTHEDKQGLVHYSVTYDMRGFPGHSITRAEYERYNRKRGWPVPPERRPLAHG